MAHPLYGEVVRAGLPALRRGDVTGGRRRAGREPRHAATGGRAAASRSGVDGGGGRPELPVEGARQAISRSTSCSPSDSRAAWDSAPSTFSGRLLGETLDNLGRHEQSEEIWQRTEALAENDSDRALAVSARSSNMSRARTGCWQSSSSPTRKRPSPIPSCGTSCSPARCSSCSRAGCPRRSTWSRRCSPATASGSSYGASPVLWRTPLRQHRGGDRHRRSPRSSTRRAW